MRLFRAEKLKDLRVVVSLTLLIALVCVLADCWHLIPQGLVSLLVSLQMIPALTLLVATGGIAITGTIVILVLTIVFGRVYCSSICPLGTLQDLIIRLRRIRTRTARFEYGRPHFLLQYAVLFVSLISVFSGSMIILSLLDPFSNFGRIVTTLVQPCVILLNNGLAGILETLNIYTVYAVAFRNIGTGVIAMAILSFGVVAYLSYYHGRLFCNTLCPAGAALGLLARVSIFRIAVSHDQCNNCGACEKLCKAGCIDAETGSVEYSACINCFNCLAACPTEAITYAPLFRSARANASATFQPSRRTFLEGVLVPLTTLAAPLVPAPDSVGSRQIGFEESQRFPISPPGSQGVERFSAYCTACHLCVASCPTQVLIPSFLEYGLAGILQPRMDYGASFCNYDCTVCSNVCPSGAILPLAAAGKKEIQIGKATFVKDDCVVVAKKKDCAACSEHCPTKAVRTVPYEGTLLIPELNNECCVGCGACEHACPTTPRKAIYVTANPVHLKAAKPRAGSNEPNVVPDTTDFPF